MPRGMIADRMLLGPRRRRRRMERQLRELDRLDSVERLPIRRSRAGSGLRGLVVFTLTSALVILGVGVLLSSEYGVRIGPDGLSGLGRLAPEVDPVTAGGSHSFLQSEQGRPVTYDSCRPLRIVVNDALAPSGSEGLVEEAAERVAAATGLSLVVEGTTDEQPSPNREARQVVRYGAGWAPILVAWSTPEADPSLVGDVAGVGGSSAVEGGLGGRRHYVTGTVSLDSPTLARTLASPGGRNLVRAIIQHELGHVVGLGHVSDPGELMAEQNSGVTEFGPGDLEGLAVLGAGACL